MRECPCCHIEKPLSEFRRKGTTTAGNPSYGRCDLCEKAYGLARRRKKGMKPVQPKIKIVKPKRKIHPTVRQRLLGNTIFVNKVCPECNVIFEGYNKSVYCNSKCRHKASIRTGRLKAKVRLRAATVESVNPTKVFIAYDWHCAACRIHTPQSLRGLHKHNSPELDHIIPLSKGGEHSYKNTQLLCRSCNSIKSDSIKTQTGRAGEQTISPLFLTALSKKFPRNEFSITPLTGK